MTSTTGDLNDSAGLADQRGHLLSSSFGLGKTSTHGCRRVPPVHSQRKRWLRCLFYLWIFLRASRRHADSIR